MIGLVVVVVVVAVVATGGAGYEPVIGVLAT